MADDHPCCIHLWWLVSGNVFSYKFADLARSAFGAWLVAWHSSLQHELLHGHPTPWQGVNRAIGLIQLSLWLPYDVYRASHLAHHQDETLTNPQHDRSPTIGAKRSGLSWDPRSICRSIADDPHGPAHAWPGLGHCQLVHPGVKSCASKSAQFDCCLAYSFYRMRYSSDLGRRHLPNEPLAISVRYFVSRDFVVAPQILR